MYQHRRVVIDCGSPRIQISFTCRVERHRCATVRRSNFSRIRVFEVVSMFVCQSGHALMSWRDKVRWDGGWTFRGSPGWGSSIMCVVTERRFVRGDKWSMFDGGTGGSWTVMNSGISQLKSSTSFLYYDSCLTWVISSYRNHPLMMYCGVFEVLLFLTRIDILLGPITKWTPLAFFTRSHTIFSHQHVYHTVVSYDLIRVWD